jgi:hypothetical protein
MGLVAATALSLGMSAPASADPGRSAAPAFIVVCQYDDGTHQGFVVIGGAFAGSLCQYAGAARVVRVIPLH